MIQRPRFGRRAFARIAAGAIGSYVGGAFLPGGTVAALPPEGGRAPAPPAGTQAAWLVVDSIPLPSPQAARYRWQLIGVAPDGRVVARIDDAREIPLRSPGGAWLCSIWSRLSDDGKAATTVVDQYSATDGRRVRQIVGRTIPLNGVRSGPVTEVDSLRGAFSADGRSLALNRWTTRVDPLADPNAKDFAKARSFTSGLEMIDLRAGVSRAALELDTAQGAPVFTEMAFAPDGDRVYAFTVRYESGRTSGMAAVVTFDEQQLQIARRVPQGAGQDSVNQLLTSSQARFEDSGMTLVATNATGAVWFDLGTLAIRERLPIPLEVRARPYYPAAILSASGRVLYVVNMLFGDVRPVDLVRREVLEKVPLPPGPQVQPRPTFDNSSAVAARSPDGAQLYVTDGLADLGLTVVGLPDLRVLDRWLTDRVFQQIWVAPGGTIYGVSQGTGTLSVIRSDGTPVRDVPIGGRGARFV